MSEQENKTKEEKAGIGGYISLIFAVVFFSGVCAGNHWWAIFDFSTLNGAFGKVVTNVTLNGDAIKTATGMFRGVGGTGLDLGSDRYVRLGHDHGLRPLRRFDRCSSTLDPDSPSVDGYSGFLLFGFDRFLTIDRRWCCFDPSVVGQG